MKKKLRTATALLLIVSILSSCGAVRQDNGTKDITTEQNDGTAANAGQNTNAGASSNLDESQNTTDLTGTSSDGKEPLIPFSGGRPSLFKDIPSGSAETITPCVAEYTVEPDLSNIDNLEQFYLDEKYIDKLSKNGFIVGGGYDNEFFEVYEYNRYTKIPNFITVDSLMHTYHLYFAHLLRNIEKDYLAESLTRLSKLMLEDSISQYNILKGSEWENAALQNVAFFTIGAYLLDDTVTIESYVNDIVIAELDKINEASGIDTSLITGDYEDYSQYKPRGYYEGDETLEKYFKSMMWYGRIHFSQAKEDMDRSALLITKALNDNSEAYSLWESIYAVTSFFAGASDDSGAYEYNSAISEAYGNDLTVEALIGNETAFNTYHSLTAELRAPQINSIPIWEGEDNVISGFRFMGQRFTIDAAIMQKLIYSDVEANSNGEKRMLPDVLDVPAALGSDTALNILEENGATDYSGYSQNMEKLREALSHENANLWSASLYACWLNTLRPLLSVKGEGYPKFMQSEEWLKKDLECFAGSFTELKHDTILYSKQVIAEMGGDYYEEIDDRGYVEPEPLVYSRFAALTDMTSQGLSEYGMLSEEAKVDLSHLSQIASQLYDISNKELKDETLTKGEYEFIRAYGGYIEHFWYEAVKDTSDKEYIDTQECPAAVIVDIATNPNGYVLEAATASPSSIYVIVNVDGKLKIAKGSVYSFYQFAWPIGDRLTDSKWRYMIGISPDENGEYNQDDIPVQKPDWTLSYRY